MLRYREMLVSHTSHLKSGLNKIYCLTQYNLITQEVWDAIMPHWLEAVVQDVTEKELSELKMTIRLGNINYRRFDV